MTPPALPIERSRLEQATVWVLLALTLVGSTLVGLLTPYVTVAIGAVTLIVLLARGRLPESYRPLPAKLMLIAFAVLAVLFVLTAKAPQDARYAFNFVMLALFGPFLWLMSRHSGPDSTRQVSLLATGGVALSLLMVAVAMATGNSRPSGPNLGPIILSNAALALAVLSTMGTLVLKNRWSLFLPLSLVAAILVAIISQSRGPLIAVLPLLVYTMVFLWRVRFRHNWKFWAIAGAGTAVIAIAAALLAHRRLAALPKIVASFFSAGGTTDRTTDIRLNLYEAGWEAFQQSPIIGHGWARLMSSAIPFMQPKYADYARKLPQLHNDVINFAVSGGIIGVGVYVLIIVTPFVAALRSRHDSLRLARIYATGGLAIVYAGGGVTDLMFGHEFHTAFYVMLNAIVLGLCGDPQAQGSPRASA